MPGFDVVTLAKSELTERVDGFLDVLQRTLLNRLESPKIA